MRTRTDVHAVFRADRKLRRWRSPSRQVALLTRIDSANHTQRLPERIDSPAGRERYGRRFATVEPVFANLCHNKRLTRFTLRCQRKVDGQ